jgi:hypothetical protein
MCSAASHGRRPSQTTTANIYAIAGGPFNGDPGLGLDRSFSGQLFELKDHDPNNANFATYSVSMSH